MKILIAEGNPLGHRLYFVRLLMAEAVERGEYVVLCVSPAVLASHEFAGTLHDLRHEVVEEEDPTDPGVLVRVSQQVGSDVTVVLDADRMIARLARRAGWRGSGVLRLLVLRSRIPARGVDRLHRTRVAVKRLLIACVAVMRKVEVFRLVPPTLDGQYGDAEIGDPVEWSAPPAAIAAWTSRLGRDTFWYGVFGVVTERKNLPLVLRALEARRARGDRIALLVAGQIDEEVRPILDGYTSAAGLLLEVEDRLLDEHELDAAVAAVDCVVLAHSNEGSSGILGKALSSGTRVLAAGALALRDACRVQPAGAIWAPLTLEALEDAAARILTEPAPAPRVFTSNLTVRMLRPPGA